MDTIILKIVRLLEQALKRAKQMHVTAENGVN